MKTRLSPLFFGLALAWTALAAWAQQAAPPAAPAPAVAPAAGGTDLKAGTTKTFTVKGVTFTMVWCPPGTFQMGSTKEQQDDALAKKAWAFAVKDETLHKVTLTKGFWMLDTQVNQELYKAVTGALPEMIVNPGKNLVAVGPDDPLPDRTKDKRTAVFPGDKIPVHMVNFADVTNFCQLLSKDQGLNFRLPTEAEWEYAARAGTHTIYPNGDKLDGKQANYNYGADAHHRLIAGKSYKPNAWNIYDIPGQHHEWCLDRCKREYGPDGKTSVTMVVTDTYVDGIVDPLCKVGDDKLFRVCRNEGFEFGDIFCRVAFREVFAERSRIPNLGFRFVQADPIEDQPASATGASSPVPATAPVRTAPPIPTTAPVRTAPPIPTTVPAAATTPDTLRLFTAGNSFHMWLPQWLTPIEKAAGVAGHQQIGISYCAGQNVKAHWDIKVDDKHQAKPVVESGALDVLTLGGMHSPDEGIDNFAQLAVAHNPKVIITLQEFWLPYDSLVWMKKTDFGDAAKTLRPWANVVDTDKDPNSKDTANFNVPTADQLDKLHEPYFAAFDKYVTEENQKLGSKVIRVVPLGQAVLALRRRVIAGEVPGIAKQSDLFIDALGHPSDAIRALSGYTHFIVIHHKDPRGLPLAAFPFSKTAKFNQDCNKILQDLAWDAVTKHPLSGFTGGKAD